MAAVGKTQRKIAEHFGLANKYIVKKLLKRERIKVRKLEAGIFYAGEHVQSRSTRLRAFDAEIRGKKMLLGYCTK